MKAFKPILAAIGLAAVPMLFTGCASVACGSRQDVALYSKPSGADVIVYNNHGEIVFEGKTPCIAKLVRTAPESGRANYVVLMKKEGYQNAQVPLKSRLNKAGAVSAFAGGLLLDADRGGSWTLCPDSAPPELKESPDMLHPDGVCLALPEASPATASAKIAAK